MKYVSKLLIYIYMNVKEIIEHAYCCVPQMCIIHVTYLKLCHICL